MFKTSLITPPEQRAISIDRRQHQFKTLLCSLHMRRRRQQRRTADHHKPHYLDIHEPVYMYIAVAILLLSCVDAVFTLTLLKMGAREANPAMQFFLEINTTSFVIAKLLLTVTSIIVLIAHRKFWLMKVRIETLLYGSLIMYLLLINYELVLLNN
ncbi:MAG: hypothetical protein HY940_10435 [Gammaproteobacteria bacterium]|nr:hypothetical protein [Gammaproteobacteria bacterium]